MSRSSGRGTSIRPRRTSSPRTASAWDRPRFREPWPIPPAPTSRSTSTRWRPTRCPRSCPSPTVSRSTRSRACSRRCGMRSPSWARVSPRSCRMNRTYRLSRGLAAPSASRLPLGAEPIDVSTEPRNLPEPATNSKPHPNTCPGCGSHYRDDELAGNLWVCPQCNHHFSVGARDRIKQLADEGTFLEEAADLRSEDPLDFFDLRPYQERLAEAELKSGLGDATVLGRGSIAGSDGR